MTPQSPPPVAGRPLTAETARADLQELVDLLLDSGETLIVGRGPANDYGNALSFILADHFRLSRPASEQPVEAIGAGREEEIPERAEGRLAERPWRVGDPLPAVGSVVLVSGVHGDIESDQHRGYLRRTVIGYGKDNAFICLQTEGCWPTVERTTNCWFAALSPASPARTPMGEPVAWIERQNDGTRYGEPKRWPPSDRARSYAQEMGRTIEPLYAAASPARTPMGGEDIGEEYDVAAHCVTLAECPPGLFFWNGTIGFKSEYGAMEPAGDGGKAWRVGNRPDAYCADSGEFFWGGSSTHEDRAKVLVMPINAQTVAMVASHGPEALAKSTPMGGEVEALREALEDAISLLWDHVPGIEPRIVRLEEALAAPTPMGGDDELKPDFLRSLPGGSLDDSTFQAIEDALDRADAPCRADGDKGRWLTLTERIAALAAPTPMGGDREHSSRCWGRTSFSDEVLHCYCQTAPTPMGEPAAWRIGDDGAVYATLKAARNHVDGWRLQGAECSDPQPLYDRQALAASSPSPAQGGEQIARKAELYDHMREVAAANGFDSLTQAIAEAYAARQAVSASPQPEAGEPVAWRVRRAITDREEWQLRPVGTGADLIGLEGWEVQPLYLSTPAADDGWRDISTAPKDGTQIILWCIKPAVQDYDTKGPPLAVIGNWSDGIWNVPFSDDWIEDSGFTHWRNLPAPPTVEDGL